MTSSTSTVHILRLLFCLPLQWLLLNVFCLPLGQLDGTADVICVPKYMNKCNLVSNWANVSGDCTPWWSDKRITTLMKWEGCIQLRNDAADRGEMRQVFDAFNIWLTNMSLIYSKDHNGTNTMKDTCEEEFGISSHFLWAGCSDWLQLTMSRIIHSEVDRL